MCIRDRYRTAADLPAYHYTADIYRIPTHPQSPLKYCKLAQYFKHTLKTTLKLPAAVKFSLT